VTVQHHQRPAHARAFHQCNLPTRVTGDVMAPSAPLVVELAHIHRMRGTLADTLRATG